MANCYLYLHNAPALRLWGLSYHQRLQRHFQDQPRIGLTDDPESLAADDTLLVIDGRWLLDGRILRALSTAPQGCYRSSQSGGVVAVKLPAGRWHEAVRLLDKPSAPNPDLPTQVVEEVVSSVETQLRKVDRPLVLALDAANRRAIENTLYGSAYKSVTDLVTKFVWPRPARLVTRWCALLGLRPNHVTLVGVILMVLAGWCFYHGLYGWGLLAGWIMTFLDTVDGKLARVTITSSKLGNVLDHGMDLLHPPFWYWLWGLGLSQAGGWPAQFFGLPLFDLDTAVCLIFIGYIGGRLAEGAFELALGSFSLFTWRPFDSFNRLITARRNPCMILLTAGWLLQQPGAALAAVVLWTLFSTVLLWLRFVWAFIARRRGPLESWLEQAESGQRFSYLAHRVFAPQTLPSDNTAESR
ncbi:MAG: CDP-alcohol phosphatidyltransferase family protein [Wenzhouxiangellaceae bacterium]